MATSPIDVDRPQSSEIELVMTVKSYAFEVVDNPRSMDLGFREFANSQITST